MNVGNNNFMIYVFQAELPSPPPMEIDAALAFSAATSSPNCSIIIAYLFHISGQFDLKVTPSLHTALAKHKLS